MAAQSLIGTGNSGIHALAELTCRLHRAALTLKLHRSGRNLRRIAYIVLAFALALFPLAGTLTSAASTQGGASVASADADAHHGKSNAFAAKSVTGQSHAEATAHHMHKGHSLHGQAQQAASMLMQADADNGGSSANHGSSCCDGAPCVPFVLAVQPGGCFYRVGPKRFVQSSPVAPASLTLPAPERPPRQPA